MTRTLTVLAVFAWFAAACVAGLRGLVNQPDRPPLVLLGFIAVPIVGFVATYLLSSSFRAFAKGIDLTLIVGSHLWRFVGLGFLIGWLNGALPAGFAIPEGSGDVIAAAGALALLPSLRRGTASRRWLLAWNTWGFIDLVSAITMGVLYSEGPLGLLSAGTVTTRWMVTFPVSLIPTFFVPLFLLLHALTFKKIADMRAPTVDADTAPLDHYVKTVMLASGTVRYVDIGKGDVLLLLHTIRTQLDYFEKVIPLLTDRYRVIALDLPGLGHSSIPPDANFDEPFFRHSVIEFIEALDLHRLTIAGESIGGVLALTIAAALPRRVVRVVSLNPYDYGERFGGGLRRSRFGFLIGLFEVFRSWTIETSFALKLVLSGGFVDPHNLPRPLFQELVRVGTREGYRSAEYRLYKHWRSWLDARNLYGDVKVPIALAYGERDWSTPQERESRKDALHPQRYVVFEHAGHFSALERPDAVAGLILAG
jgi:pimeloyl-ACP methyl ester carboxylesterase